jgi:hypothetical protein
LAPFRASSDFTTVPSFFSKLIPDSIGINISSNIRDFQEAQALRDETVERLVAKIGAQRQVLESVWSRLQFLEEKVSQVQYYADHAEEFKRTLKDISHKDELIRRLTIENDAFRHSQECFLDLSNRLKYVSLENERLRERLSQTSVTDDELVGLKTTLKAAQNLIIHLKRRKSD